MPLPQALERRAAPLPGGEEGEYMLALKQELRRAMRGLPYFVKPGAPRRGTGGGVQGFDPDPPVCPYEEEGWEWV